MAASGLNPFIRYSYIIIMIILIMIIIIREENSHKYQHLMELMEFAFALQVKIFRIALIPYGNLSYLFPSREVSTTSTKASLSSTLCSGQ